MAPLKAPGAPSTGVHKPSPARAAFRIRELQERDLAAVVRAHREQFPDGFYSQLGDRFVWAYFREYLRSSGSVGLVATTTDSDELVGYLIGTVNQSAHDRDIYRRSAPALASAGAAALARRPAELGLFIRTRAVGYLRRYVRGVRKSVRSADQEPQVGELLYIYTAKEHRRKGCGAVLLRAFVEEAQRANTTCLELVTEQGNVNAREFYAHRGWSEKTSLHARDGRPLLRLELPLTGGAA